MRTKTKGVTVKLTPTERKAVNDLCLTRKYESISEVLRDGLRLLLERHKIDYFWKEQMDSERRVHRPRHGRVIRPSMDEPIV